MHQKRRLESWVCPNQKLLPDFIIGGAGKSGTTSIHQILAKHPKVFLPIDEVGFFDIDNILQHSDFNFYDKSKEEWVSQTMLSNPQKVWDWYLKRFEKGEGLMIGEDSTTYIASKVAAERIAIQPKPIKMIFTLRQPSQRAYSQYFHKLRTGRATYSFEDTLRFDPFSVVNRSLYMEQLPHYYKQLPKEQIKVVLFEDLISDMRNVIIDICNFLELDHNKLPADAFELHANPARIPKNISMQIKRNHRMRNYGNIHYTNKLPNIAPPASISRPFFARVYNFIHRKINPQIIKEKPKLKPSTKAFLDEYFYMELEGINELVGFDVLSSWFPQYSKD